MKIIALLGGSGSGKTELSLEIAARFPSIILSLDSLSIYKEIDIVSAKPTLKEREIALHFGIDVIKPNELSNVQIFMSEFQKAKSFAKQENKNLLIVGGSSFYLKSLLSGISPLPLIQQEHKREIANIVEPYNFLEKIDSTYAKSLKKGDTYRIQRALEIYFATNLPPSEYFAKNPPKPILKDCMIFEIFLEREILKKRLELRTKKMLDLGLIDEISTLIQKYGKKQQWIKSVGVKESVEFLEGKIHLQELEELICLHTLQLAKRQKTFNKTQFKEHLRADKSVVFEAICKELKDKE